MAVDHVAWRSGWLFNLLQKFLEDQKVRIVSHTKGHIMEMKCVPRRCPQSVPCASKNLWFVPGRYNRSQWEGKGYHTEICSVAFLEICVRVLFMRKYFP